MKSFIVKLFAFFFSIIVSPFYWLYRKVNNKKTVIKYNDIVDGFSNYVFPNERVERIALRRASVCASCPFAKYNEALKQTLAENNAPSVKGMYCDACGCSLSLKIRSMNTSCPKNKW